MSAPKMFARHWIGGEWVDSEKRMESINPANGETIGTYTEAGEAEATRAIVAALKAFRETDWRKNRGLRAKVLNDMADRFEARAEDLVKILALENGKIKPEAQFELSMVPSRLRFYAALALADFGRAMETSPGRYTTTLREAAGVAGIITPWNSPVVLFIRSLAPALAAGCTAVGKLPGFTAQTNARMCENRDTAYHKSLMDRGCYIGFDTIGIDVITPDEIRIKNLAELTGAGYARQIVLSHDYAGCWQFSEEDMLPYLKKLMTAPKRRYTYLIEEFIPGLREAGVSQADIDTMTRENPRRYFAGEAF